jgi:predicted enzyme related to lactoylglutathione lyase
MQNKIGYMGEYALLFLYYANFEALKEKMMLKHTKAFSSFSVMDIAAAKAFYEDKIGLQVSEENGMLNLHTQGNTPILLYPKPNHIPATFTVLNLMVEDIEQAVDELTRRGVAFEHYDGEMATDAKGIATIEGMGIKQAWFKDPSGNYVSLIEEQN